LREVLFRSLLRLFNKGQPQLRENLETTVRRVGGWCEMAASLGNSEVESSWAESSAFGSQLVQLWSCGKICDSQRRREAVNKGVEGSTVLEAVTRKQVNTQQTRKIYCVLK
jgi:hypothetical protein